MNFLTQTCPTCRGSGVLTNQQTGAKECCPRCNGDGEIEQRVRRVPFDFILPRTTIAAANGTATVNAQTPKNAPFEWWSTVSSSTGTYDVIPEIDNEKLVNRGTKGNESGIANVNWAGTAQLPSMGRVPYILAPGRQVTMYLTDTSNAINNAIQIVLRGYLLEPLETPSK